MAGDKPTWRRQRQHAPNVNNGCFQRNITTAGSASATVGKTNGNGAATGWRNNKQRIMAQ
jgi:hypothetical protein